MGTATYVCDPHLRAINQVPAVHLLGRCLHGDDITPRRVLTHRQAANLLPRNQPREVLLLLLVIAVEHQLVDTQLAVRRIAQPNAPARPTQLLHDNTVCLVSHGQATVLLRRRYTEEPSLTELLPHVVGERIVAVCLCSNLLWYLAAREVLHAFAELVEVGLRGRCEVDGVFGRGVADAGEGSDARRVAECAREQTRGEGCHCEW